MKTNMYSESNFNTFDFSFTTSSGDKIDLAMYDKKSVEYKSVKTKNSSLTSMTLTHQYGYKFSYVGNGLDKNDIKEINEALKNIAPKIDDFMKNINNGKSILNQDIVNLANSFKKMMPEPKDLNHKNYMNDETLKLFDKLLQQNKATKELLEKSQKLFDSFINLTNKFSFYV